MLTSLKKIIFLSFFFCVFTGGLFAYTSDEITNKQANQFVRLIQKKLATFPSERAEKLENMILEKLIQTQNTLIGKTDVASLQKNALYESIRRKLLEDSFDSEEAIFDDGVGAIWTHAPRGFGILYNPTPIPTIGSLSSGTKNTLINGSYFSRQSGAEYHSGLLWTGGMLWSNVLYDDVQITHIVCLDKKNTLTFWSNTSYFDGLLDACETAFQAGPMIYHLQDGDVTENLAPQNYIGRAHNRTVMVLFENGGKQDLWFLTLIKPATLADVRDTVLRESRFRGEYDTLTVFNLDGGSSVAHRNPDHPELNFGSSKTLPVVFEIYK